MLAPSVGIIYRGHGMGTIGTANTAQIVTHGWTVKRDEDVVCVSVLPDNRDAAFWV